MSSPHRHLPRLLPAAYQGFCFAHWIPTVANRKQGWLTDSFHDQFRACIRLQNADYAIALPGYCLMPDHLHLVAAGTSPTSDQRLWIRAVIRDTNEILSPEKLQRPPFDHVLRSSETGPDAFIALIDYIRHNPVRAGLVAEPQQWPYSGSVLSDGTMINLHAEDFGEQWWDYWNKIVS